MQFKIAKFLVYNQVKKQLGLDECTYYLYGAAPLDPQIRYYFLSLNFFLINSYGMSESTGPQNFSNKDAFDYRDLSHLREVGSAIPGTEIKIIKSNPKDEDGIFNFIQDKFATGAETYSWAISRTLTSPKKSLIKKGIFILETWAKLIKMEFFSSQEELNN